VEADLLLRKHHSHQEIARFYRAASLCMVTSLHDGMNLVAKEFAASRDDEHGVLILSTFAGAALELTDALLVNPYDVQQVAPPSCAHWNAGRGTGAAHAPHAANVKTTMCIGGPRTCSPI